MRRRLIGLALALTIIFITSVISHVDPTYTVDPYEPVHYLRAVIYLPIEIESEPYDY